MSVIAVMNTWQACHCYAIWMLSKPGSQIVWVKLLALCIPINTKDLIVSFIQCKQLANKLKGIIACYVSMCDSCYTTTYEEVREGCCQTTGNT